MSFKKTLFAGAALISGMTCLPLAFAADMQVPAEMSKQDQRAVDNAQPANVAAQIMELHDKLHITTAQEDKWKDVAEAMTDTAKEVRTKLTERAEKVKTANLTAVDELHAYQDLQQVQFDGVKRLMGPFETLYASMSPAQMKNADGLFEQPGERAEAGGGTSHRHVTKAE